MLVAKKLGVVVKHNKQLSTMKSYDPSVTCYCDILPHIKYVISPLALDQWKRKCGGLL